MLLIWHNTSGKSWKLLIYHIYIWLMEVYDGRIQHAENILWPCIYVNATKSTHDNVVIMSVMASQLTSLTIVYSTVYSGADTRKHQSSPSLTFLNVIHWWPVNSPHKEPVTRKMFPFYDVIMLGAWHFAYEEWGREHRIHHLWRDCSHARQAFQGPFHRIYELIIQIL